MAFEVFKLIHEKEITDILWREDREAFIELLKKAYDDGYNSGFISGYDNGYHDIPETPWK
jgi:hypothetical protein